MRTPGQLAKMMAAWDMSPEAQLDQIRFRAQLVEGWGVTEGMRVLEIGCGQGDTTVVLADRVGERGKVTAIDFADPSSGAPVTLGDSARALAEGPLGDRIEFRFGFDPLDPSNNFEPDSFDLVTLAHCTWYFDSLERLAETLATIRPWAPRLCLSEWDLVPRSLDQLGHFLAAIIQGQISAQSAKSESNIRTLLSADTVISLLGRAGWQVNSHETIDTSNLRDGHWEISACLADSISEARMVGVPTKEMDFLNAQLDVLRRLAEAGNCQSLHSFSIVMDRSNG